MIVSGDPERLLSLLGNEHLGELRYKVPSLLGKEQCMSWFGLVRNRSLGKKWFQNLLGEAFLKRVFLLYRHWKKNSQLKANSSVA